MLSKDQLWNKHWTSCTLGAPSRCSLFRTVPSLQDLSAMVGLGAPQGFQSSKLSHLIQTEPRIMPFYSRMTTDTDQTRIEIPKPTSISSGWKMTYFCTRSLTALGPGKMNPPNMHGVRFEACSAYSLGSSLRFQPDPRTMPLRPQGVWPQRGVGGRIVWSPVGSEGVIGDWKKVVSH